jgi:hypothetical protein
MDLGKIVFEDGRWMLPARDSVQWWAVEWSGSATTYVVEFYNLSITVTAKQNSTQQAEYRLSVLHYRYVAGRHTLLSVLFLSLCCLNLKRSKIINMAILQTQILSPSLVFKQHFSDRHKAWQKEHHNSRTASNQSPATA